MRNQLIISGLVAIAGLASAGCLVGDTTQTIYLEKDGSVTWVVAEENLRSDEGNAIRAAREEAEYMTAAAAERGGYAGALRHLGAADARTEIVRARRPYAVRTEATFTRVDWMLKRLGDSLGGHAMTTMRRGDGTFTWAMTLIDDAPGAADPDEEIAPLLGALDGWRFVLTEGRFVDASGFEISKDARIATLRMPDSHDEHAEPVLLSLTWTVR